MTFHEKKIELIKKLVEIQDQEQLDQIEQILASNNYPDLSEELLSALSDAESSYQNGNVDTHENVMRRMKNKFPNLF